MSSRKRLSKEDVEIIFNSVASNELPPIQLSFKVIRTRQHNAKVSPPPFQYKEGIYVILTSLSKNERASVPSALTGVVLAEEDLSKQLETCYWRSSGLKSHKNNVPSAKYIVRYCYPQGDNEYSLSVGASVWTMRNEAGNECFSVRILHIYQTQKRASTGSLSERPKKKVPWGSEDDISNLMKGELITTPIKTYEDCSMVTLSSPDSLDPECLFELSDNDSDSILSLQPPASSAVPYPVFTFLQPDLTSFARKVDSLTREVLESTKEDQAMMVQILQQRLEDIKRGLPKNSHSNPQAADFIKVKTEVSVPLERPSAVADSTVATQEYETSDRSKLSKA